MPKLKSLPSPAFIVACLALFVAIGGVGYAAVKLKKDSVGAKQIKANAVRGAEIKDGSVASNDLAPGTLPAVFAAYRDEAVPISNQTTAPTQIATLSGLPAGAYAITAKTLISSDGTRPVDCKLLAPPSGDGDFDTSEATARNGEGQTIALQIVHEFPADGGEARVECGSRTIGAGATTISAQFTKIQAIKVSSQTNDAVTG